MEDVGGKATVDGADDGVAPGPLVANEGAPTQAAVRMIIMAETAMMRKNLMMSSLDL
jgi:hypothetical protein